MDGQQLAGNQLAVLGDRGDRQSVLAGEHGARLLVVSGKPINESIVQYGPFVMNTAEEIEQAYRDYEDGLFGHVGESRRAVA